LNSASGLFSQAQIAYALQPPEGFPVAQAYGTVLVVSPHARHDQLILLTNL